MGLFHRAAYKEAGGEVSKHKAHEFVPIDGSYRLIPFNQLAFRTKVKRQLVRGGFTKINLGSTEGYKVSLFFGHVQDSGTAPGIYIQLCSGSRNFTHAGEVFLSDWLNGLAGSVDENHKNVFDPQALTSPSTRYGAILIIEGAEEEFTDENNRKALLRTVYNALKLTDVKVSNHGTQVNWWAVNASDNGLLRMRKAANELADLIAELVSPMRALTLYSEAMTRRDAIASRGLKDTAFSFKRVATPVISQADELRRLGDMTLLQQTSHIDQGEQLERYRRAYERVGTIIRLLGPARAKSILEEEVRRLSPGGPRAALAAAIAIHKQSMNVAEGSDEPYGKIFRTV